ncbi:putative ribonuclease H-like domain-containing protein [Tanacetum coccineum]
MGIGGIGSAGGVSAGSTSAGSDPAGGHPAGPFQTAGSYDPAALGEPAALGDPAASTSVSADFIPVHADESTLPPGQFLGSSENTKRFPVPSDVCKDQFSSGIFTSSSYDDDFRATLTNLAPAVEVNPVPTKRVNTIHPQSQILGDLAAQFLNKKQSSKSSLVECVSLDPDWVDAMQEEMQQFINQQVWKLVPLPAGKHAIGTKWILKNKRDARGIVVRNKARLVAQGHRQEEGIDYDEVFAPVARIEAIRLFLAFASYLGFLVYQLDCLRVPFLLEKSEDEVMDFIKHLESGMPRLFCFSVTTHYRRARTVFKGHATNFDMGIFKKIFKYLKGQPKLGLWYPKDSPFQLEAYSDSDYASSHGDRKSTTGSLDSEPVAGLWIQLHEYQNLHRQTRKPPYALCWRFTTDESVADLLDQGFDDQDLSIWWICCFVGYYFSVIAVILSAGRLVSAGRTMILLAVILSDGVGFWLLSFCWTIGFCWVVYDFCWRILLLATLFCWVYVHAVVHGFSVCELFLLAEYIHAAGVVYAANTSIHAAGLVCAGGIMFLLADLFLLVVTCFCCAQLDIAGWLVYATSHLDSAGRLHSCWCNNVTAA